MSIEDDAESEIPAVFADPRYRTLLVLSNALVIVAVGFFYLEGLPQLFVYGLAVLDVPVSLYVFGRIAEGADS